MKIVNDNLDQMQVLVIIKGGININVDVNVKN